MSNFVELMNIKDNYSSKHLCTSSLVPRKIIKPYKDKCLETLSNESSSYSGRICINAIHIFYSFSTNQSP